ncbi:hypothetical protein ACSBR2_033299 [Camellia fascicularis]
MPRFGEAHALPRASALRLQLLADLTVRHCKLKTEMRMEVMGSVRSGGVSLDFDVVGGWGQKGEIEVGAVEGLDAKGEMVRSYLVGSCGFGRLGGLGLGFGFEILDLTCVFVAPRDSFRLNLERNKDSKVLCPWVFPIFGHEWNDISPNEVAIALEMLRNYEPLKEDCKMQLTLELTTEKSYRILDSLVLEALGGVDIQLLRNCLPNTADDVFLAEDVTFACSVLADGLFVGLYELAAMKASALLYFQEAVIFPLSDGRFGPFTDEFIEVIKIADHERRMQGDRFISVKHLLFGLSLSSVRRCVEMMLHGRVLDYTGQLALKLSLFSIYKLSRDAATILGDKNVGLEHLVLAIFYGKQENDRTGTAAQDDCSALFFDEKKWDDYLLKHLRYRDECDFASFNDSDSFRSLLPEDCLSFGRPAALCGFSIMDELHKALKSGLKLNAIRG